MIGKWYFGRHYIRELSSPSELWERQYIEDIKYAAFPNDLEYLKGILFIMLIETHIRKTLFFLIKR